jgi:adenine-specific DNA glycosylase
MLARILAAVRDAGRPLCLAELSGELGIPESALEGMLQALVARGRLRIVEPALPDCGACPLRGGCMILTLDTPRAWALPHATSLAPEEARRG